MAQESKYKKWVERFINETQSNSKITLYQFCKNHDINYRSTYDCLKRYIGISVGELMKKRINDCEGKISGDSSKSEMKNGQAELFPNRQNMPEQTKTCGICGRTLPISQFYTNSETSDGIDYRCKECNIKQRRKTNTENRKIADIKDFSDEALCGELRRRGFVGELSYHKTINI